MISIDNFIQIIHVIPETHDYRYSISSIDVISERNDSDSR